ncbi:cyclic GMP-AMP synthase-like [Anneissia japonica]|uniref:cyclic GMP-AMP synthase-like n=1 Tax=Anneissia japonica TaxID=1529436 RepID=UPI0014259117|nr:cyclic GMP-AMP synthase-like [Anneissia japonica]XP_033116349.1 cyclic GMP-AMP synthase-like [Anneissia japonica]
MTDLSNTTWNRIYKFVTWLLRKNIRNPDTAEEDDIGPIEPAIYGESLIPQRKSQPLLMELRRYYRDYVAIPVDKRYRAFEVVEDIKNSLQKFVQDESKTNYTFGDIMPQGSSYEGLKVVEPNEFDLLLPLILKDSEWRSTEAAGSEYHAPGYVFIRKCISNTKTPYDDAIDNDVYLSPIEIKRKMQSIVQRAVKKLDFPNVQRVTLRESGPALTLEVIYDDDDYGSRKMFIDIVPSMNIRNKLFVAKRHPESDQYQNRTYHNIFNNLWRVSFSEKEKEIIREMDGERECRRTCLKILKTIQLKKGSSQLGMLSSYHLKTCMLHLNADKSIGSWHQDNLDDRFKDLLMKLIQFLKEEKMPSFSDRNIDLFSTYNTIQLQNIRDWLERKVRSDDKIIHGMLQLGNN